MIRFFILLSLIFSSCSNDIDNAGSFVEVTGREPERISLYRVNIPEHWEVIKPDERLPLTDSRLPLLECRAGETLKIVFHNFPTSDPKKRIPPGAQIERWKKQLKELHPASVLVTPQSFSGYIGLRLEAQGKGTAVIGYALQIDNDHYRNLAYTEMPEQMRADITIKATGSPEEIAQYRLELMAAAQSFELIEEIPIPR